MNDIAISVKNLSKKYRLYDTPQHRLKEALHPFRKKYHRDFWALKDISFEVKKGENVGIIGRNGSGKSTLLQIICGVLQQSQGNIRVNGKISALLELGAGFNPEFTGRENVYLNGAINGFSKEEMDKRFDAIAEFADIGDFIEQPVKTYSSGMYVRLAFSAAINVDPDILVVDEALSVGDMFFQAKCALRINELISKGITFLFVSHDINSVKSLCKRAILLQEGRMIEYGNASVVAQKFFESKVNEMRRLTRPVDSRRVAHQSAVAMCDDAQTFFANNAHFLKMASYQRIQNGMATFVNVSLIDESGKQISTVDYEQKVVLRMAIEIHHDITELGFGYHIRDTRGINVVYSDSHIEDKNLYDLKAGDRFLIDWTFICSLEQGNHTIGCMMSIPIDLKNSIVDFCDSVPIAYQFSQNRRHESLLYGKVHWHNGVSITKC
jgi:lipopolysaccharide transport system ATP-binding protein